jgi:formylglycine-generating enzyme required for sulfatase activity
LTRGFWIGKYEVTQGQWDTLMEETMRQRVERMELGRESGIGPEYPFFVSDPEDADAFCLKLTAAERAAGRLPEGWTYGLPTEAQWEYACRAGTTTATAFGDRLSSLKANFSGTSPYNGAAIGPDLGKTAPVGSYPPNPWGIHDMHGNVWEWTADSYRLRHPTGEDPHVTEPGGMPTDATQDRPKRSIRGGCWQNSGAWCRSAHRAGSWGSLYIGFRVALIPAASLAPQARP